MIKCICDVCGKDKARNKFEYLCHLGDINANGGVVQMNVAEYIDNEGNSISGRTVGVDLCNKCYNEIVGKAVDELRTQKAMLSGKRQKRQEKS